MSRTVSRITVDALDAELRQTLTLYHEDVNAAIDRASEQAVKDLVTLTKATAPVGARHGNFRKNIASKEVTKSRGKNRGKTYAWYVKPPDHRLTHLLVHGHATKNGGRTKSNPFLQNAMDQVTPKYINNVEEALKNGR